MHYRCCHVWPIEDKFLERRAGQLRVKSLSWYCTPLSAVFSQINCLFKTVEMEGERLIKSVQHCTSSTTLFYKVFIWIVPCNQVTTPKPSRFTTLSEQFQPPLAESESASSSKVFVLKAGVQIKIQTLWMYQMVNFSGLMLFFFPQAKVSPSCPSWPYYSKWKGRSKLYSKRIFLWCNPFQRVCGIEHRRATASAPGRPPAALIQRRWCIGLVIIQGCLNEFSQSQEHVYNPGWPISSPGGLFHSTDLDWEICSLALHYFFFFLLQKMFVCVWAPNSCCCCHFSARGAWTLINLCPKMVWTRHFLKTLTDGLWR